MKVLLLQDVKALGRKGDICEVKEGYGNNFLINKGLAIFASNEAINRYKAKERKRIEEEKQHMQELNDLSEKIKSMTLIIKRKVGGNGSLFGAITKDEISQGFKDAFNINIDKKALSLKTPIKNIGVYEVDLNLGFGIHTYCRIDIRAQ